ncbi:MAG TPA: amino acid permease [Terriglobales bacterium]|nr:amino acid permease [Terriglobales bacterium]
MSRRITLRRQLNTFDTTSLVVGSAIGADIFVVPALSARLLGPASLLIWLMGAVIAIVIAMCFAYCTTFLPKVGGSYAYTREVAGPFPGFMVGWSLLLAEWFSLAVFPVVFTQYFLQLYPNLDQTLQLLLKAVFVVIIALTNIYGVKTAGKFNDALTIVKLGPLFLLICLGALFMVANPHLASSHFQPFLTGSMSNVGQVLVLIFWAYAGFELSSLPADEIEEPKKTLPKALFVGMLIVAAFYIITNFVVIGVVDQATLSSSSAPLTVAAASVLNFSPILSIIGGVILTVGALASILGADESGSIGTSRLAFAMSLDGLLPKAFSRLQKSYRTPYVCVIVLCATAFVASVTNSLSALINSSVFLLSFAYLATCVSAFLMERRHAKNRRMSTQAVTIPILGVVFSLFLMSQVNWQQVLTSAALFAIGVPIYRFFAPKKEQSELKNAFLSRDAILERAYHQGEIFLANVVRHIKWRYYKAKKLQRAWKTDGEQLQQ